MRKEKDFMGFKSLPSDAYWGIHTERAMENFKISGLRTFRSQLKALALVKAAAADANAKLHGLDRKKASAIKKAAEEVAKGKLDDQFRVDIFQAGAGTPLNMNMNEVVANRAIEILGGKKGNYKIVHPNDDVNMSQSTNDTYPTAMRIAALWELDELKKSLNLLVKSMRRNEKKFSKVYKTGRTHLRDAIPISVGQEFGAWAFEIERNGERIDTTSVQLKEISLGGTAVGTGINTHPRYGTVATSALSRLTGMHLKTVENKIALTQFSTDFAAVSGALRSLAIDLLKISNDVRLLSSGPMTGIDELILAPVEAGSSIMPGKVNPSIEEMLGMVCYQVIGNDASIAGAAAAGQLELNVFTPVIAYDLLQSIEILSNSIRTWTEKSLAKIKINRTATDYYSSHSIEGAATALSRRLGYAKMADLVTKSIRTGKSFKTIVLEERIMTEKEYNNLTNSKKLTKPNL